MKHIPILPQLFEKNPYGQLKSLYKATSAFEQDPSHKESK